MLVGVDMIEEIIETVLTTSRIKESKPVSVILVGPSGCGKSEVIMEFCKAKTAYYSNDLTTMEAMLVLQADKENKIRHFVLPDLNPTLSHKPTVTGLFLSKLLTLQSEGILVMRDGRRTVEVKHDPIGLVTACTPEMYEQWHRKFRMLGLLRRNAPIFYTLSEKNVNVAQKQKREGTIHTGTPRNAEPQTRKQIKIPALIARLIEVQSQIFASNLTIGPIWQITSTGERVCKPGSYGYLLPLGPHDFLRTVAKAHALKNNRDQVNEKDYDFLATFVSFTKYGTTVQV